MASTGSIIKAPAGLVALAMAIGAACSLTTQLDGLSDGVGSGGAGNAGADGAPDAIVDSPADLAVDSTEVGLDTAFDLPVEQAGEDATADVTADGMTEADGPEAPTADEACTSSSNATCIRMQQCAGPFAIEVFYRGLVNCKVVTWNRCMAALQAPGSGDTPAGEKQCATDLLALPCKELLANHWPQSCQPVQGTVQNGEGCWHGSQCVSAHCTVEPGALCGFCAAALSEGQLCQHDGQCGWSLQCRNSKCRMAAHENEPCLANRPCAFGLACNAGTCKPAKALGEACDPSKPFDECNLLTGLFCASTGICAQATSAGPGALCGENGTSYALCEGGAQCMSVAGENRCILIDTGKACAGDGGFIGPCEPPGGCLNSVCTLPNAQACP